MKKSTHIVYLAAIAILISWSVCLWNKWSKESRLRDDFFHLIVKQHQNIEAYQVALNLAMTQYRMQQEITSLKNGNDMLRADSTHREWEILANRTAHMMDSLILVSSEHWFIVNSKIK